jgi:beta-lactamase regulating signal transducer with metallopeptidase domain
MTIGLLLLVKATVILTVAIGLDGWLSKRHVLACAAMWNAVLVALLLLPVAALALPKLPLPLLKPVGTRASTVLAVDEPLAEPTLGTDRWERPDSQEITAPRVALPRGGGKWQVSNFVGPTIAAVYVVGILGWLVHLIVALIAGARLQRTGVVVQCADWQERLARWRNRLHCGAVELRQSTQVQVPLMLAVLRPTILLPRDMTAELEARSRDAIIVHELAHVMRGDFAWQFVLRVVQAALWFHPLIWLAERRMHFIRERACDDFTIHALGNGEVYADTLLAIASRLAVRPVCGLGLAVTRTPHIAARIEAIAASQGNTRCRLSLHGRLLTLLACLFVVGLFSSVTIVRAQQTEKQPAAISAHASQNAKTRTSPAEGAKPDEQPAQADKEPEKEQALGNNPPNARKMRVQVLGDDERPLAGAKVFANVTLVDPVRINNREYTCDAAGQATLELPAEPIDMLRLWADSEGRVGWHAHWWPKYQPDGHLVPDQYTFRLEKGTVIGGIVSNEGGQPIKDAKVSVSLVQPLAADFQVRTFRSIYLAEVDSRHDTRRTTDAEGRWMLDNVPGGDDVEVLLKVEHPDFIGDVEWGGLQKAQGVTTKSLRQRTGEIVMRRAAGAGSTQGPETAASENPGVISGEVVLSENGSPVTGATVLLRDGRLRRETTDQTGRFRFNDIRPGHYEIWAIKEPLTSPKQQLLGQPSNTEAKGQFSPVRLPMSPGKQIKVTVTSAVTGRPVEGAQVELGYPDRGSKVTGNDGSAVLQALLPQQYRLTIQAAGHARVLREIDLRSTGDLTVQTVSLSAGGTIRGTVTDEDNKPLAKAGISFRTSESPVGFYGESPYADDEGKYRSLYLPLNTPVRISAALPDFVSQEQEVTLTEQQRDLELNFQLARRPRGGSIGGVVTDSDGKPIVGASVDNFGNTASEVRQTKTDVQGQFKLDDVVKSFAGHELILRAAGFIPARQRFEPTRATGSAALSIKLEKGHSIRARVQDAAGRPVAGAYVEVNGGGFRNQIGESLRTDRDGQFSSNSLPLRSTFRIYADGYSTLDKAQLVLDGEETLLVTLQPMGVVRGRVLDEATGRPIEQFRVRIGFSDDVRPGDVRGTYGSELGEPGLTFRAADGAFTVSDLTSRMPFKVLVDAEGYEQGISPRVVAQEGNSATAVDVSLKKRQPMETAALSGQVVDFKGTPVPGVQLRLIASAMPSDGDNDNRFNWVLIDLGQLGQKDYGAKYVSAVTDNEGKFELKELLAGKFLQLAYWGKNAPKGRFLALAKTKPGVSQSVTIRLPEPASVRGSFDATAFANPSRMSLTLQGEAFHHYWIALTDGKSDFSFENLPPGKYWLSVMGQPERSPENPDLMSYRPIASRLLTVQAGKTLEVQFTKDDQIQRTKR